MDRDALNAELKLQSNAIGRAVGTFSAANQRCFRRHPPLESPGLTEMKTFTVQLADDVADKLSGLADVRGVTVEYLMAAGAEELADDLQEGDELAANHQWSAKDIAAIEEGLAQIERGETIPHEQVVAEIKAKYGW